MTTARATWREPLAWAMLGAVHGLTLGVPLFYLLVFEGDGLELLDTVYVRFVERPIRCGPDALAPAGTPGRDPEDIDALFVCVPVARHPLDPGTVLTPEHVEVRPYPPDFIPPNALRTLPERAEVVEAIYAGELLRQERLR